MKRIAEYMGLETEGGFVRRLLEEWVPASLGLCEKDHEEALFRFLSSKLPDVPIVQQYGIAKGKADIVIQDSHVIELKLGLTEVLEFDRCLGQLERYRQKWICKDRGPVYLVIVGESDSEFRDVLNTWVNHANSNTTLPSYWGDPIRWVEKRQTVQIK